MRIGFNMNVDREAIDRIRRAHEALNGVLDRVTDDPRHRAAKDRFELDAHRRVNIISEASKHTPKVAVRAEHGKAVHRIKVNSKHREQG